MKFAVLFFISIGFFLLVSLNFFYQGLFFPAMSKLSFPHILFVDIFYVTVFLNSNFPCCSFPNLYLSSLFFAPLCINLSSALPSPYSLFPLFNLLPSILQFSRVSHLFIIIIIVLLFWTVSPYSLPLFVRSLFLISFIP